MQQFACAKSVGGSKPFYLNKRISREYRDDSVDIVEMPRDKVEPKPKSKSQFQTYV